MALISYCTADLLLDFHIGKNPVCHAEDKQWSNFVCTFMSLVLFIKLACP